MKWTTATSPPTKISATFARSSVNGLAKYKEAIRFAPTLCTRCPPNPVARREFHIAENVIVNHAVSFSLAKEAKAAAAKRRNQIYHSKLRKVPIPDMTAVLSVRKQARARQADRTPQAEAVSDDLAKALGVLVGGEGAVVQLIPRIDQASVSADRETTLYLARKALR